MTGSTFGRTRFKSIHEIPDEWIPTSSKRDPDNRIYETRRYINAKKKQFLFQQEDGVSVATRTRIGKFLYFSTIIGSFVLLGYNLNGLRNIIKSKK